MNQKKHGKVGNSRLSIKFSLEKARLKLKSRWSLKHGLCEGVLSDASRMWDQDGDCHVGLCKPSEVRIELLSGPIRVHVDILHLPSICTCSRPIQCMTPVASSSFLCLRDVCFMLEGPCLQSLFLIMAVYSDCIYSLSDCQNHTGLASCPAIFPIKKGGGKGP